MKSLKHILCLITAILIAVSANAQMTKLAEKLDEYVLSLEKESAETKCEEVDFLINSTTDSLSKQFVAIHLYTKYITSKGMGDEAVAIHITDTWFAPGKVKMQSELDLMNAKIFADFNRESLIGKKAPSILPNMVKDRPVVLYFYDIDCPKCKLETLLLKSLIERKDYPIDFIAFYTSDNEDLWKEYIGKFLSFNTEHTRVSHHWDPTVETDFQKKYGLLQTPKLFLIDTDRTIIGRSLDTPSLEILLDDLLSTKELTYGSENSDNFFDMVFSQGGGTISTSDMMTVIDQVYESSSEGLRKRTGLRQTMGDLLYYLGNKNTETFKVGASYLIRNYVKNDKLGLWANPSDSLQIIGYSDLLEELMNKPMYGKKLPAIKVEATVSDYKATQKRTIDLSKKTKNTILIFHTEGCPNCKKEMTAAREVIKTIQNWKDLGISKKEAKSIKIVDINIDQIIAKYPSTATALFDKFDLSTLPFILTTNEDGLIDHKYFSLTQAQE